MPAWTTSERVERLTCSKLGRMKKRRKLSFRKFEIYLTRLSNASTKWDSFEDKAEKSIKLVIVRFWLTTTMSTIVRTARFLCCSKKGRASTRYTHIGVYITPCHKSLSPRCYSTNSTSSTAQDVAETDNGENGQTTLQKSVGSFTIRRTPESSKSHRAVRQTADEETWKKPKFWSDFEQSCIITL